MEAVLSIVSSSEPVFTAAECRALHRDRLTQFWQRFPGFLVQDLRGLTVLRNASCVLCGGIHPAGRGVLPKMPDVAGVVTQVHALITDSQLNTQHLVFSA